MQCTGIKMAMAVASCALILLLPHGIATADTEKPRVVLTPANADLVVGPGMNAAGRDLRGCKFFTQDLSGANFDGCNLYGCHIVDCILRGASFRNAIFVGSVVDFGDDEGADLTGATINGSRIWRSPLYGIGRISPDQLMSTWSYKNKDLHQCQIYGPRASKEPARFDFRGADLRETTLGGDLTHCDFTDARISGARFGGDSITFKQLASTRDFKRRRLSAHLGAGLWPSSVSSGKWDFSRINLEGSTLRFRPSDVDFTDATIRNCEIQYCLTTAHLYSTASYKQGKLMALRLREADLSGCDLSGMNLTGSSFIRCKFAGASLEDAVITDASFNWGYWSTEEPIPESDHLTLDQIKSTWNYKHGRMAGIRLPEELAKALEKEAQTTEEEPAAGESGEKTERNE